MKKITTLLITIIISLSISATALAVDYGAEYQKLPTPQTVQKFSDVPTTHWAFDYIGEMAQRDVLSGYPDGRFIPENQVTRAEFAKIMVCAAGLRVSNVNTTSFTDVYTNDWFCPYVECAKDYLTGYTTSAGTIYKPTTPALREDIAVALVKLKGYDISLADESILNMFTDSYSISSSARKYVAVAVERGIVSGYEDNTFRGQATITRAEAATLLWRAFQYGNDNKVVDNTTPPTTPPATQDIQKEPIQTQATPKPTEKPVATVEPTNKPASTPEPTEKPFKIDTVVKAAPNNNYCYTYSNSDNIYYVENSKIHCVSIATGDEAELLDLTDLIIDNDEMTLADFNVESICYDNNESRLLILGRYNSVNAINPPNNHYLYSISQQANDESAGKVDLITDNFYDDNACMIGVLSNGDYIMAMEQLSKYKSNSGGIIDKNSFNKKSYFDAVSDVAEIGGNLYYVSSSRPNEYVPYTHSFTEYDFVNENIKWDFGSNINSMAVNNEYVVFIRDNIIYTYNHKGKLLDMIAPSDCRIADMTATSFSEESALVSFYASGRLLLTNYGYVFYDANSGAFRIVTGNN